MDERDAYEVLQVHPKADAVVVRAAYRALAAIYHPDRDGSQAGTRRMGELNAAYDKVRSPDRRTLYDRTRTQRSSTSSPIITPPPGSAAERGPTNGHAGVVDFGRYTGWTIQQLAHQDPDYLRWLSRHSSGMRYRAEIETALRETSSATDPFRSGRAR